MNKNFVLVFTLLEAKNCLLRFFGAKQCLARKMLASRGRIASIFVNTWAMLQLLQGLLRFAEKTIHQTTKQWTLAPKTIELRDTKVQRN